MNTGTAIGTTIELAAYVCVLTQWNPLAVLSTAQVIAIFAGACLMAVILWGLLMAGLGGKR